MSVGLEELSVNTDDIKKCAEVPWRREEHD